MTASLARLTTLAAACIAAGCAGWSGKEGLLLMAPVPGAGLVRPSGSPAERPARPAVVPAASRETAPAGQPPPVADTPLPPRPLEGITVLTTEDVVRVVLERNPTLDQMRAVAAAVAARYPQVTSLDDPNF